MPDHPREHHVPRVQLLAPPVDALEPERAHLALKEQDANSVSGVMTTNILSADPTASVEDVRKLFDHVSGVPVVDSEGVCVGIVSKKDLNKKGSTVAQIMSAPARTIKKTNSVGEAAAIMLKYKVNRLPVVSRDGEVIGIVSRTDIFTALESMEE